MAEILVFHDQPLRTLFFAPITEHKHMLNSDRQKVLPWGDFRECRNFYISLIVFDVQIILLKVCFPPPPHHRLFIAPITDALAMMDRHFRHGPISENCMTFT